MSNKRATKKKTTWYMKNASTKNDPQLKEFMTKDLGDAIEAGGGITVIRPQRPTSILLPPALVDKLKARAARLGIGYQTLLKMIVSKYADDEL